MRRIIDESYAPESYFSRVVEVARALDCSKKKLRLPFKHVVRDLKGFGRMLWRMGVRSDYRWAYWKTVAKLLRSPRSLRYSMALMALYLHFGAFRKFLVEHLVESIENTKTLARGVTPTGAAARTAPPIAQ